MNIFCKKSIRDRKPNPTEIAFEKAAKFDKLFGFFVEHGGGNLQPCSRELRARYLIHDEYAATMLMGVLERALKKDI